MTGEEVGVSTSLGVALSDEPKGVPGSIRGLVSTGRASISLASAPPWTEDPGVIRRELLGIRAWRVTGREVGVAGGRGNMEDTAESSHMNWQWLSMIRGGGQYTKRVWLMRVLVGGKSGYRGEKWEGGSYNSVSERGEFRRRG